jgi:Na+-translocating ferredoxin:NAD+ oxidoreductase RnfD subunit
LISYQEQNYFILAQSSVAVMACAFAEWICQSFKKKITNLESPIISGLIIGCVLSVYSKLWIFPVCGIITILFKHVIRWKSKHIFNPAALGILITTLFFDTFTEWKGAYNYLILIPIGGYFMYRFNRWKLGLSYFITSALLVTLQAIHDKTGLIDAILYLNYFFLFIMLIEPKTTPSPKKQQILFGSLTGITASIIYLFPSPVDAVLPALLIWNLLFFIFKNLKKGILK